MSAINTRSVHMQRLRWIGFLAALAAVLLLAGTDLKAQRPRAETGDVVLKTSPKFLAAFRPVLSKSRDATVRVFYEEKEATSDKMIQKEAALGTVVEPDGWILTKASELKSKPICKLKDGRTMEAKVVGVHDKWDLALLKIEAAHLPVVEWTESKAAPVGNWGVSVGTSDDPLAVGVVRVAARNMTGRGAPPAINFNSGFLGVSVEGLEGSPGVKIMRVEPGSGAAKAGLKVNDIILSVSGKPIPDQESLFDTLRKTKPNDVIDIKIKRDDKEMDF